MRKEKFPTTQTPHKLIICPTNCTQHRTKSFRLAEKKTFDPIKGKCNNCKFKTVPAGAVFHGPGWKSAKELLVKKNDL